ncbi:MAG: hypothetical protein CMN28_00235 [Salinisphaeraceae bacterium]|jgi:hypothetical protein|nr:hypothetical protein [Salinisphaeraceae bacterium]
MSRARVVVDDPAARRRRRWLTGLLAGLVFVGFCGAYALGRIHAAQGWEDSFEVGEQRMQSDRKRVQNDNRRLRVENRKLSERIVALELDARIDKEAAGELKQSMSELQTRLANLRKEVGFYRGIVSPESEDDEPRIQQFSVRPTGSAGEYEYDLVLIRSAGHSSRANGSIIMRLDGLRNGEAITLNARNFGLKPSREPRFGFKYFQELAGSFSLPENFEPTLFEIEVVPAGGTAESVKNSYDWSELTQD